MLFIILFKRNEKFMIKNTILKISFLLLLANIVSCNFTLQKLEENKDQAIQYVNCKTPVRNMSAKFNDMFFDIQGLDEKSGSQITPRIYFLQDDSTMIYFDHNLSQNDCIKVEAKNDSEYLHISNKFTNQTYQQDYEIKLGNNGISSTGQKCKILSPTKGKVNFTDVVIKVDCKTPVTLKSNLPKQQSIDFSDQNYYLTKPILNAKDDQRSIINPSFEFLSDNPDIGSIDKQTGKLQFHKAGKIKITVNANQAFYTSKPFEYWVEAKKSDIKIQSLEIGQSSILTMGTSEQTIAPNNKTLVRALVYSPNYTPLTKANLTIISATGEQTSMALTCPTNLNSKAFDANHYKLNDTCFAILDTKEELKNLRQNSLLKFEFNNITKYAMPNVSKEFEFKVTMVKGRNSKGEAKIPTEKEVGLRLLQVFPLSKVSVETYPDTVYLTKSESPNSGQSELIIAVKTIESLRNHIDKTRNFYGFIPDDLCHGAVGLGYVGGAIAVGLDIKACQHIAVNQTMMHEIGHNLSLGHAPCGTTEGIIDPFWKLQQEAYSGSSKAFLTEAPLFVQATNEVKSPYNTNLNKGKETDLMAYCEGTRLSNHNYNRVANFMNQKANGAYSYKVGSSEQMLAHKKTKYQRIISGEILYDSDKIILNPIDLSSNQLDESLTLNAFGYMVEIKTAKKTIKYPLQILQLDHSPVMNFKLVLPIEDMQEEIQQISFWQGDKKIPYQMVQEANQQTQAPFTFSKNLESKGENKAESRGVQAYAKVQESQTLDTDKIVDFKNNVIVWDNTKYKFMTSVFINELGKRSLIANQEQGGFFTVKQKLIKGELEIYLSDGINSKAKTIKID